MQNYAQSNFDFYKIRREFIFKSATFYLIQKNMQMLEVPKPSHNNIIMIQTNGSRS